jgi:serine/threonine protein kinase
VSRQSNPQKKLIAKYVPEDSNELEILQIINRSQPKSEHVISLLDSFYGSLGTWIVLPKLRDIYHCLASEFDRFRNYATQICWGLIEGLAFLHKLCIAHRDIKPRNLLLDWNFSVKIIDFDLAVQVEDEDDVVGDYCGTEGWLAPEIENKVPEYSPIRADRWSCGCFILYLLGKVKKMDSLLEEKARALMADEPSVRPSLLEWQSWVSTPSHASNDEESTAPAQRRATDDYAGLPEAKRVRYDADSNDYLEAPALRVTELIR